jgi:hypothetical protein
MLRAQLAPSSLLIGVQLNWYGFRQDPVGLGHTAAASLLITAAASGAGDDHLRCLCSGYLSAYVGKHGFGPYHIWALACQQLCVHTTHLQPAVNLPLLACLAVFSTAAGTDTIRCKSSTPAQRQSQQRKQLQQQQQLNWV